MGKSRLALTYTTATILGWGAATILNGRAQHDEPPSAIVDPTSSKSKPSIDGDQLIEDALATLKDAPPAPNGFTEAQMQAIFADYDRLKDELPPTADPEQTFRELLGIHAATLDDEAFLKGDPAALEVAVRLHHWLLHDPADALNFLSANQPLGKLSQLNLERLGKDFVAEMGFARSLAALKTLSRGNEWVISRHVIRDLASRGSIEDLLKFKQADPHHNPDAAQPDWGRQLGEHWPTDRGDELLDHLQGPTAASAAVELAKRMDRNTGYKWILELLENDQLDSDARRHLNNPDLVNSLVDKEGVSVDDRVATYQALGVMKDQSNHFVGARIIDWKLREFMVNEDDWHFAFRHGEATAAEVLNAAMNSMPDFKSRRGEVASQLFRQLAEDNPAAAMELIADQSAENIAWARTNSTRWAFYDVNPNDVHSWATDTADLDDQKQDSAFLEGWRDRSAANLSRFGDEYLQWAAALPEGKQRNMALEGIIDSSKDKHPHIADEAKTLLENGP